MEVRAEEFQRLRAWFGMFMELAMPFPGDLSPEEHPVAVLDAMALEKPAAARQGLEVTIGDVVEMTINLPPEEVARLDAAFAEADLPTLSNIRARFMRQVGSIVRRGRIRTETEYYALRNAVDAVDDEGERQRLWGLLNAYEGKMDV